MTILLKVTIYGKWKFCTNHFMSFLLMLYKVSPSETFWFFPATFLHFLFYLLRKIYVFFFFHQYASRTHLWYCYNEPEDHIIINIWESGRGGSYQLHCLWSLELHSQFLEHVPLSLCIKYLCIILTWLLHWLYK